MVVVSEKSSPPLSAIVFVVSWLGVSVHRSSLVVLSDSYIVSLSPSCRYRRPRSKKNSPQYPTVTIPQEVK